MGSETGLDTFVYEKNLLLMPRIERQLLSCPACTQVTILTTLFQLPCVEEVQKISVAGQFSCLYVHAASISQTIPTLPRINTPKLTANCIRLNLRCRH